MDGYLYKSILQDEAAFKPIKEQALSYVELRRYNGAGRCDMKHGRLLEEHIPDWLGAKGKYALPIISEKREPTEVLRVLISPFQIDKPRITPFNNNISAQSLLPLPLSSQTFVKIMECFKLPQIYLLSLNHRLSSCEYMASKDGVERFVLQSSWTRDATYSLAISYQPKARITYSMLHGLRKDEIDKLLECLKLSEEHIWFPMLLPLLLLQYKGESIQKDINKCYMRIWDIEQRTGMPAQAIHHENAHENTKNLMEIDYDTLTRDITSFSCEMARYQSTMEVQLPLLDSLTEMTRLYLIAAFQDGEPDRDYIEKVIRARVAYLRTFFSGIRGRVVYHTQRAQAQRETVWSLVAQKDNLLNLRIAESTQRDSTAMKTIATITTVFLPATFTATLFSTSFFNFQPKDGTHTVSGWFWLYWIFTFVLTIAILGSWYLVSRKKLRVITKKSNSPSKTEVERNTLEEESVEQTNAGVRASSARAIARKPRVVVGIKEMTPNQILRQEEV